MSKKVLVVLSGSNHVTLKSGKRKETGFFLNEAMVPIRMLKENGIERVYANPNGISPQVDPLSDRPLWFGFSSEYRDSKELLQQEMLGGMDHPLKFSQMDNEFLKQFDAVFIPGGHAPMEDLGKDPELGRILLQFHNAQKPTVAICHGPIALLSTKGLTDEWCYKGYEMTCYSNLEEKTIELMWRDSMQVRAEDALREAGANIENRLPMLSNLKADKELITGQGPTSAWKVGEALVEAVQKS
jgi:putative intracellular protease/amidase